jgi:hypothetical protein
LFAGLALAATAQAGTPALTTDPAPSPGQWSWFAGGSVGYLTQLDDAMYGVHAGMEYKSPGARSSHAIFLQVGLAQDDASYSFVPGVPGGPPISGGRTEGASIDLNIIPITLNYKYEGAITGRLNYYAGLGAGVAILDSSYDWSWAQVTAPPAPFSGGGSDNQTNVRLYGEVFAGLSYDVSDAFEVFAGLRYILMDNMDHHIDVTGVADYEAGINNDLLLEAGLRFHF